MKFNLEIHRKALKFLEKLNEDAKGRILEKIKNRTFADFSTQVKQKGFF